MCMHYEDVYIYVYTRTHTYLYTNMTTQIKVELAGMSDADINSGASRKVTTTTNLHHIYVAMYNM